MKSAIAILFVLVAVVLVFSATRRVRPLELIGRLGVDERIVLSPTLSAAKLKLGTSTRNALRVPDSGEFTATVPEGGGLLRFSDRADLRYASGGIPDRGGRG